MAGAAASAAASGVADRRPARFTCQFSAFLHPLLATQAGIEDFSAKNFGLVPLRVEEWGSYVLVNASRPPPEEAGGGRPASAPPGAHAGEPAGERAGSGASASSSGAAGGFGGGQSFRELLADAGRRLDCFQSDLRHIVTKARA